jgi:hypothetical protein
MASASRKLVDEPAVELAAKFDRIDAEHPNWDRHQTELVCAEALRSNTLSDDDAVALFGTEVATSARQLNSVLVHPTKQTAGTRKNQSASRLGGVVRACVIPFLTFLIGAAAYSFFEPKINVESRWLAVADGLKAPLRREVAVKFEKLKAQQRGRQISDKDIERLLQELLEQRKKLDKSRLEIQRSVVDLEASGQFLATASKSVLSIENASKSVHELTQHRWPDDFLRHLKKPND